MKFSRRQVIAGGLAAPALLHFRGSAQAQSWPSKQATVIVPFPAGGGTDAFARPLAAELSKNLGQTFVIDNRGGAGGTLGASIAARAPKDGYTYFIGAIHHTIAPSVYNSLTYDLEKDFQPIAVIAVVPQVVVVNPERVKATTLKELMDYARANPGKLTYASAGPGTSHHLAGELFKLTTKLEIDHVPYKGAGPALQDLIGGQVDMMFDGLGSSAAHIKGGRIRPLAVAAKERSAALPNVPTATEAGVAGYEVSTWYAIWTNAGAPQEVVSRMTKEVAAALKSDQLKTVWANQGAVPGADNPKDMAAFVASEIDRWRNVVANAKISLN